MNNLNGFKHINQPDFDRERDGAISEIQKEMWTDAFKEPMTSISFSRRAYNEGYKQALRDWVSTLGDRYSSEFVSEIIEDVDRIDKENA